MLDTTLLEGFEDSFVEDFFDQYLLVITDYVFGLSASLKEIPSSEIASIVSEEDRTTVLSQLGKFLEFAIEFELWDLCEEINTVLEKIGVR